MKMPKNLSLIVSTVVMASALGAVAGENQIVGASQYAVFSAVGVAEMPAKAAELVGQAKANDLKQTTIDVVRAAVGQNPSAAPDVVASIARVSPDMAAIASATAARMVPRQAAKIAAAAAAACPSKAGAIVKAVCQVRPADYKAIAQAVAQVVPGADRDILAAVSSAIPQLKSTIDQSITASTVGGLSVTTVFAQAPVASVSVATAPVSPGVGALAPVASHSGAPVVAGMGMAQGPTVTYPSTPPPTPTSILNPSSGGSVPSGSDGYHAP